MSEPIYYDLISLNETKFPDVKKGTVTVTPNPKYNELEGEEGNKVLEVISTDKIRGTVSYDGLLQDELQAIQDAVDIVSEMTIYNPFTGQVRTFLAKVIVGDSTKILHDETANAWSYSFEFEEIDYISE